MIYRAIQLIQIFLADGRTGERTNEGNPRGPRGPKKESENQKVKMRVTLQIVNVMFAQAVELLRQTTSRLVDRFMPDLLLHSVHCLFDFDLLLHCRLLLPV